ncbi:hypothetical protein C8R44DRAFT_728195 [Mycena epipterygia]|nr:hypothetical protein C8R44DRAFT_728195 [Mycena epipterygia]
MLRNRLKSRYDATPTVGLVPCAAGHAQQIPGSQGSDFSLGSNDYTNLDSTFFSESGHALNAELDMLPIGGQDLQTTALSAIWDPIKSYKESLDDDDFTAATAAEAALDPQAHEEDEYENEGEDNFTAAAIAEVALDPQADEEEDEDEGVGGGEREDGHYEEDMVISESDHGAAEGDDDDQLESSKPTTPAHPSAPPNLIKMPLRDRFAAEEQQIGGGRGPAREATPPPNPPISRLRSHLICTEKASPQSANAVARRSRLEESSAPTGSASTPISAPPIATLPAIATLPPPTIPSHSRPKPKPQAPPPPPIDAPPPSPIVAPLPQQRAFPPPPPPIAAIATLPAQAQKVPPIQRKQAAQTQGKTTMGPPPPPPPSANAAQPPPQQRASLPPPPPIATLPAQAQKAPPMQHKKVAQTQGKTTMGPPPPPPPSANAAQPPPPAPNQRQKSRAPEAPSTPNPFQTGPALKPTRRPANVPPSASTSAASGPLPPGAFRGASFEHFTVQGEFQSLVLPAPPPGWSAEHTKTLSEVDQDHFVDDGYNVTNGDDNVGDDDADGDTDQENTPEAGNNMGGKGGRPTAAVQERLEHCFNALNTELAAASTNTGLDRNRVLKRYLNRAESGSCGTNVWNEYEAYANSESYIDREYLRVYPDFEPEFDDDGERIYPLWSRIEMSQAFKLFKDEHPKTWREILKAYTGLSIAEKQQTLATRQRHFRRVVKNLQDDLTNILISQLNDLEGAYRYQSFLVVVGSHVNEDAELGALIASPGGLQWFAKTLNLTNNELIGIAKVLAYTNEVDRLNISEGKVKIVDGRLSLPRQEASAASSPSTTATTATTRVKIEHWAVRTKADYVDMTAAERDKAKKSARRECNAVNEKRRKVLLERMSDASKEDIGQDLYRDLPPKNGFGWLSVPTILANHDLYMEGLPSANRLFGQFSSFKGSGGLWLPEIGHLEEALDTRAVEGQGLRIVRRPYVNGDIVVYTHDYAEPTPAGLPSSHAVVKHWKTSGGRPLPCMEASGRMYKAVYDNRCKKWTRAVDIGKGNGKPTRTRCAKDDEGDDGNEDEDEDDENDDDDDAEDQPPKVKAKAKPRAEAARAKGKGKAKATEEVDEDGPEEEEPTVPPPTRKLPARVARMHPQTFQQEGGGPLSVAPKASRSHPRRPHVPSPESSDADSYVNLSPSPPKGARPRRVKFAEHDDMPLSQIVPPSRKTKASRSRSDDEEPPSPPQKRQRSDPAPVPEAEVLNRNRASLRTSAAPAAVNTKKRSAPAPAVPAEKRSAPAPPVPTPVLKKRKANAHAAPASAPAPAVPVLKKHKADAPAAPAPAPVHKVPPPSPGLKMAFVSVPEVDTSAWSPKASSSASARNHGGASASASTRDHGSTRTRNGGASSSASGSGSTRTCNGGASGSGSGRATRSGGTAEASSLSACVDARGPAPIAGPSTSAAAAPATVDPLGMLLNLTRDQLAEVLRGVLAKSGISM